MDSERLIGANSLKKRLRKYYDMVLLQDISDEEKLAKHDMLSDVMVEIDREPTIVKNKTTPQRRFDAGLCVRCEKPREDKSVLFCQECIDEIEGWSEK